MDISHSSLPPAFEDALKADLSAVAGLDALSEEERNVTLMKIGDVIFQMVLVRVFEELGAEGQKEVDAFIANAEKTNDFEGFYSFLRSKVPNLDELVAEEVAAFKKDAMRTMGS
jgi:hypothetical protein